MEIGVETTVPSVFIRNDCEYLEVLKSKFFHFFACGVGAAEAARSERFNLLGRCREIAVMGGANCDNFCQMRIRAGNERIRQISICFRQHVETVADGRALTGYRARAVYGDARSEEHTSELQ